MPRLTHTPNTLTQLRINEFPLSHAYCDGWVRRGRVTGVSQTTVTVQMIGATAGSIVIIETPNGNTVLAEVRSVGACDVACTPLESVAEITVGAQAATTRSTLGAYVGYGMLGHCVDAWGRGPDAAHCDVACVDPSPIPLDERRPVARRLRTGIAAIDALCTIGAGQRVALFSGAGVGKSTLLRQIAERADVDAHVVALIGERGREAAETLATLRASQLWTNTTVVCATADACARERYAAARTAAVQAQWLCERGYNVLLTVDSLTRVANAWRELALGAGEPPAHRGHPASMVAMLASIVERAGARAGGSVTGVYAVLVDGDDPFEPVTDAVRGLLDGHIVLSRALADAGRYPPIDVLRSSSRMMHRLASAEQRRDAAEVRRALAALERAEDLFAIGAYNRGGDPALDAAVAIRPRIEDWIFHEGAIDQDAVARLAELASALRDEAAKT